jgi:hypothetical protein
VVCHDNALQAVVRIEMEPAIKIGISHAPTTKKSLPFYQQAEELPLTSKLSLTAVLPYHELDRLYRGHSYSFRQGKTRFQLDQIGFHVAGERLRVSLHLSGESSWSIFKRKHAGTLTLEGIPLCDRDKQTLRVSDLSYAWKSADPILNLILRFQRKKIDQVIGEYVDHLLADTVQDSRRMAADAIRNHALTDEVLLDGQIDYFVPGKFLLEPGGMTVVADVRGRVSIRIGNL